MAHHIREPAQLAKVVRHREYYLRGGDITFLVENHLYRVHSYFFDRESTFFHHKLSTPSAPGEERPGTSDRNAFTLEGVRSIDFERFIWCFYNPKYSLFDRTVDEWSSILELADGWSFSEVKALAVRELEKIEIEPIQKIYIYHRYNISRTLLLASYSSVSTRPDPLSLSEGHLIGIETSLRIAEARERIRAITSGKTGARSPTFADFSPADVEVIVREVFEINGRTAPTPPDSTKTPVRGSSRTQSSGSITGALMQQDSQQATYSYGGLPQSPNFSAKPGNGTNGFGQFFGSSSIPNLANSTDSEDVGRASEQSPKMGNTLQFPTSGSGEPLTSGNRRSGMEDRARGAARLEAPGRAGRGGGEERERMEATRVEVERETLAREEAARQSAARETAVREEAARQETIYEAAAIEEAREALAKEVEAARQAAEKEAAKEAAEAAKEEFDGDSWGLDELQTPADSPAGTPTEARNEAQAPINNDPLISLNNHTNEEVAKSKGQEKIEASTAKKGRDKTNEPDQKQGGKKEKQKKGGKRDNKLYDYGVDMGEVPPVVVGGQGGRVVEASSGTDGGVNAAVDGAEKKKEVVDGGVNGDAEKVRVGGGNSKVSKKAARKAAGKKRREEEVEAGKSIVAEDKTSEDKTSVEPIAPVLPSISVLPSTPAITEEIPVFKQPGENNIQSTPESDEAGNSHVSQAAESMAGDVVEADAGPANTTPVAEPSVKSVLTDAVEESSAEQLIDEFVAKPKQLDPAHPVEGSLLNFDETSPAFSDPLTTANPFIDAQDATISTKAGDELLSNTTPGAVEVSHFNEQARTQLLDVPSAEPEPAQGNDDHVAPPSALDNPGPSTPGAPTDQILSQHINGASGSADPYSDASIHEQTSMGVEGITEQTSIKPELFIATKRLRPQLTGTSMASDQATVYEDAESAHGENH